MIKISKLADYAIIVLSVLHKSDGTVLAASSLAQLTHIPEPTVAKVTKKLSKAGVINSVKGANGGYTLSDKAQDISIYKVIKAIDGPLALVDCVTDDHECSFSNVCPTQGRWNKVNAVIQNALEDVKLSDMVPSNIKEDPKEAIRV
ncbi:MAG: SUF system Fe-S cluster assembly regulator [Pseudomonadota bacterium]